MKEHNDIFESFEFLQLHVLKEFPSSQYISPGAQYDLLSTLDGINQSNFF